MPASDETFVLLPATTKMALVNNTCPSKKGPLLQIPIIAYSCSSCAEGFEPQKAFDDDYFSYWKGSDLLPPGEYLDLYIPPSCWVNFVDILFKDGHLRTIACRIAAVDEFNNELSIFHGAFGPTKNDITPVRCVCVPKKTNKIRIRGLYYTINGEGGRDVSYPNPEIAEVRVIGFSEGDANLASYPLAYFKNTPMGYKNLPPPYVGFGEPTFDTKLITPDNIIGISAIQDQSVIDLDNHKDGYNNVANVVKVPYDDKWSGKGVGSTIIQEYTRPVLLRGFTIRTFQIPPRSYQFLIRIYESIGMKTIGDLDHTPCSYQKIINVPEGMGDGFNIPIDPIIFNDNKQKKEKTLALTMRKTSDRKGWCSILDFYGTGKN